MTAGQGRRPVEVLLHSGRQEFEFVRRMSERFRMVHRKLHQQLARNLRAELDQDSARAHGPALAEAVISDALRERATDIHVEPTTTSGALIRFRIDGSLVDVAALTPDQVLHLDNQLKVQAQIDPLPAVHPVSSRWTAESGQQSVDIRLSVLSALGGERLALRLLDPDWLKMAKSVFDPQQPRFDAMLNRLQQREGMLLVTGPTGSGKTTTVYGLLQRLVDSACSILCVEDPPEYQLSEVTQFTVDAEHGITFPEGIHGALRMDPDYLMVGELRDSASAAAALDAATTGCAVISTLHARDAVGVITSLRKWDLHNYELSTLLSAVVAQRLVKRLCPECREPGSATEREQQWLESLHLTVPDRVYHARGCEYCSGLGYRGRTAIFESWLLEESDRRLILEHADERELRQHLAGRDHRFLLGDAMTRIQAGEVAVNEIRSMGGFGPGIDAVRQNQPKILQ